MKTQCEQYGVEIVTFRDNTLNLLLQAEKVRCDNELERNTFRKTEIQNVFAQRDNVIDLNISSSEIEEQILEYHSNESNKEPLCEYHVKTNFSDKIEFENCDVLLNKKEKEQILKWSGRSVGDLIFTYKNNLKSCSVKLRECFHEGNGFVIALLYEQNVFGVVVTKKVDKTTDYAFDEDCFIFQMRDNGDNNYKMYKIKAENFDWAFSVGVKCSTKFFDVGCGDINVVYNTTNKKVVCKCAQSSFDYKNCTQTICGVDGSVIFNIQKFVVYRLNDLD
ncbi:hypothetical protein EIN_356440 [Entamoeba invadens IP1]|uniref:TLDc domain-containing protein n=1 Tax=Entamoeba invadens IP1 TaxID=370355 RepID=L7FN39_ENTIV|nr:hypothetical protein EIN_356440 [Entamoeba invadens IP1]ELP92553.1 hypothetical protein EIN_356440 [Entamoeba invadens IP1]|eukprot:XP_004259324.1 hypothetical protein EIN_356440 [Entamoeba invadens IP1]